MHEDHAREIAIWREIDENTHEIEALCVRVDRAERRARVAVRVAVIMAILAAVVAVFGHWPERGDMTVHSVDAACRI